MLYALPCYHDEDVVLDGPFADPAVTLVISTISTLRVVSTAFAMGTGISIPVQLLRGRDF